MKKLELKFWLGWLVATGLAWFVLAGLFRVYTAEIKILVVPKTQLAALSERQMVADLIQMPTLLTFYERLLVDNPQISDPWVGHTASQRKAAWNKVFKINTTESKGSGIIKLVVFSQNKTDAEVLSQAIGRTWFAYASKYYNLKDDFAVQAVDGPLLDTKLSNWGWLLILAILLGYGLAEGGLLVSGALRRILQKSKQALEQMNLREQLAPRWSAKNPKQAVGEEGYDLAKALGISSAPNMPAESVKPSQTSFSTEAELLHRKKMEHVYPNFPEMPRAFGAPDNLPITEDLPFTFGQVTGTQADLPDERVAAQPVSEPSVDEYKQRLNDLLKGRL